MKLAAMAMQAAGLLRLRLMHLLRLHLRLLRPLLMRLRPRQGPNRY